ncbi:acyl-CoA thioesterase domain-containing protein [Streptomyces sp. NPDC005012]|uniref:acyl-CoA thioesterase domain-containing protein n=1 Tax=unclassified Streptomyces TaxID=2593676 RepID=UPI0033A3527A
MDPTNDAAAFFTADGDTLLPGEHARSWWTPDAVHGRLLGGLLARALEREHGAEGLHFARLTVDLFRACPFAPLRVTTERIRDGRRIRVADAVVHGANGVAARASAVLLRRGEQPAGPVPATPDWDAPPPEEIAPVRHDMPWNLWLFGGDNRPVESWEGVPERRAWLRDEAELVAGEALSPFVRVALAADTASPMAHRSDDDLEFINADYTLTLARLPLGDAIGFQATAHSSEEGVAVGHCALYDTAGPIGYAMTTALANARQA